MNITNNTIMLVFLTNVHNGDDIFFFFNPLVLKSYISNSSKSKFKFSSGLSRFLDGYFNKSKPKNLNKV